MKHYLGQVAPEMDWNQAKVKLWRSVDVFGKREALKRKKGSRTGS
jgi:hypothetical protein